MDFSGFQGIRPPYFEPDQRTTGIESKIRNMEKNADSAAAKELKEIDTASRDLESLFVYMLLKEMRKTVPETKFMHGGRGEEIFRDMLDEELSKKISAAPGDGIGIAKVLYEQLSKPTIAKMKAEQAQNQQGVAETEPDKK